MSNKVLPLLTGCVLFSACKSSTRLQNETARLVSRKETAMTERMDSTAERMADSVFVLVHKTDSMLHLVKETTHWREKVKVVRDTVVVNVRSDTVCKTVTAEQRTIRSPPSWKFSLALILLVTAVCCQVINPKK